MIEPIRRIWHPERYHGLKKKDNFLKVGTLKMSVKTEKVYCQSYPASLNQKINQKSMPSFNLLMELPATHYIRFDVSEFECDKSGFNLKIGNCTFSESEVYIDIERKDFRAFGELNFKGLHKWVSTRFSPGTMGWYSFVPFMECNHEVISLNHRSRGKILINKNIYLFTFGRGYIEKDWGQSFPSSYIWMQSNNFDSENVSFFCSIARIPWFGGHFRGFIIGLMIDGYFYKFATYTGAKLKNIQITEEQVEFEVKDRYLNLRVKARKNQGGMLLAPYNNEMQKGRVHETLLSEIEVELIQVSKKGVRTIFNEKGQFAGLEIVGNLKEIM